MLTESVKHIFEAAKKVNLPLVVDADGSRAFVAGAGSDALALLSLEVCLVFCLLGQGMIAVGTQVLLQSDMVSEAYKWDRMAKGRMKASLVGDGKM